MTIKRLNIAQEIKLQQQKVNREIDSLQHMIYDFAKDSLAGNPNLDGDDIFNKLKVLGCLSEPGINSSQVRLIVNAAAESNPFLCRNGVYKGK